MSDAYFTKKELGDTLRVVPAFDNDGKAYDLSLRGKINAADDLLISPNDYAKFCGYIIKAVRNNDGPFRDMFKSDYSFPELKDAGMGLGWFVVRDGSGNTVLYHSGADKGVHSFALLDPAEDRALIVLTSGDNGAGLWKLLAEIYLPSAVPFLETTGIR